MILHSNPWFVGIDPGNTGFICFLQPVNQIISFVDLSLSAIHQREELHTKLNAFKPLMEVAVEDVHSIYGASSKSTFGFGYALGRVHFLLESCACPYSLIAPKVWQKKLGIVEKDAKLRKKLIADTMIQIYPKAKLYGPRGGLITGKSDALAIAHVAYLIHKEENENSN